MEREKSYIDKVKVYDFTTMKMRKPFIDANICIKF